MTTTDLIIAIQLPVWSVLLGPYGLLYISALEGPGLNVSQLIVSNSQKLLAAIWKSIDGVLYLDCLSADGYFIDNFLLGSKWSDIKAPTQTGL